MALLGRFLGGTMSREHLFRAKRRDNKEFETGSLVIIRQNTSEAEYFIADKMTGYLIPVIPETVGQFTGLTDKNGKKIFEGDVMQLCSATYPCTVYWDGIGWAWKMNGKRRDIDLTREKMEVIGNKEEVANG